MNVDAVLCVGDLVDGPGDADETLGDILREPWRSSASAGNHERWLLGGRASAKPRTCHSRRSTPKSEAFIRGLERMCGRYDTPAAGRAILCHGVGDDDEAWLRAGHARIRAYRTFLRFASSCSMRTVLSSSSAGTRTSGWFASFRV